MSYTIKPVNDKSTWEQFILRVNPNALFQGWPWGEVQKKIGSGIERFGVYDASTLVGIFQTVDVCAKRGSFLHVRHGPVLANQSVQLWGVVLAFLREQARRKHMLFVRMNPVLEESPHMRLICSRFRLVPAAIHRMDGEQCWMLNLQDTEDEILAGMRKTTRYEIRRAAKEGAEVIATTSTAHFEEFMTLYQSTSIRQGFVPHKGLREEFQEFARFNQAVLYMGYHQGVAVSGAIILYYGKQAIYHHGASVRHKVPVSHAVQWEAIKQAKKRGMDVYNFWGIAPENSPKHPWNGITVFKKGFGGYTKDYIHAQDMPISPLYLIPKTVELIRRLTRGYD